MSTCIVRHTSRSYVSKFLRKALGVTDPETFVCHHCDNGLCINTDHVYLGDAATNNRDAARRNRYPWQVREACPQGHPLDGVRTNWNGSVKRYCLTCNRERAAAWRASR